MVKETDLRVVRTKRLIEDAFFDLLEEVGFAKITVDMIARKAMINRSTFYLHYSDKFDLLAKTEEEMLRRMRIIIQERIGEIDERALQAGEPLPHIVAILDFFRTYPAFFRHVTAQGVGSAFALHMVTLVKEIALPRFFGNDVQQTFPIQAPYFPAFATSLFTGLVGEWIRRDFAESSYELASMITGIGLLIREKIRR
ncbi:MAG: TetR/AcrR family transcriptional regulator [Clostridiales Family XIII bacterium]|jgi:AcrR family transcriptional regulator|nr:TetR/AcrR family transcriptional regulator [Clostridiales Family XIII bacterium]